MLGLLNIYNIWNYINKWKFLSTGFTLFEFYWTDDNKGVFDEFDFKRIYHTHITQKTEIRTFRGTGLSGYQALFNKDCHQTVNLFEGDICKDPAEQTGYGMTLKSVSAVFISLRKDWLKESEGILMNESILIRMLLPSFGKNWALQAAVEKHWQNSQRRRINLSSICMINQRVTCQDRPNKLDLPRGIEGGKEKKRWYSQDQHWHIKLKSVHFFMGKSNVMEMDILTCYM